MSARTIAVVGATGAQGGGLVRAILNDSEGRFSVRALTRDPSSDKAKALADLGAEVVAADVSDADSLKSAFEGAYGAYCVTFFWEHFSPETELANAKAMAQAAKENNLEHVIWSTLDDTRKRVPLEDNRMPTLMEKYKVPHFDAKGEADQYFVELGLPVTLMLTSFYWDNFIYFGLGPKRGEDGKLALSLPCGNKKLPGIAAEDIGKCAYGIFKKGKDLIDKTVGVSGGHPTGAEMASSLAKGLGEEVVYNAVPFEVFRGLGFPGAEDLGNMFQYKHDFNEQYCADRSIDFSREVNPELMTLDAWLEKNKASIPLD